MWLVINPKNREVLAGPFCLETRALTDFVEPEIMDEFGVNKFEVKDKYLKFWKGEDWVIETVDGETQYHIVKWILAS